ncbi:MAG: hypothetical protein ACKVHR_15735 [Pirellulales bacterium]|jgi:type II secretory pathway component PulF
MKPADVQKFHNDLRAAVIAQAPVEIADVPSTGYKRLTLDRIDQLEDEFQKALPSQSNDQDETDSNSWFSAVSSAQGFPKRYLAAMKVFVDTGSMPLVLDGLVVHRLAHSQVAQVLRRAFLYLGLLLAVAVCGLYVLGIRLLPQMDDLRADISNALGETAPERIDEMSGSVIFASIVAFGLLAMILWACFGGIGRLAVWLGGRHYVRCQISSTAMETIRWLTHAGVAEEEAVNLSCDLTGADSKARSELLRVVSESTSDRQMLTRVTYFQLAASTRLEYLRATLPATLTCSIGGVVVLIYCLSVFLPILSQLRALSQVGI